jgi:hypothetical protein
MNTYHHERFSMPNQELINKIASGAQAYYKEARLDKASLSEIDNAMDSLADEWMQVQAIQDPSYSSPGKVSKFLKEVAREVLKEIVTKHNETFTVTLTFVTQQLAEYLITRHHITQLDPYLIPLEILAALIFAQFLKTIKKNL